jgi:hypothetical protein
MIEADKFYNGRIYRAEWLPNLEDPTAPTLALGVDVDGDTITHYLRTTDEEKIDKMKRQLAAIGVSEAAFHSPRFVDNPKDVIGEPICRIKTRMTNTGKVTVGFICDAPKDLDTAARSGLLARLGGGKAATAPAPKPVQKTEPAMLSIEPDDVPF